MISKYYEIEKFKNKTNYFLFYGENEGQKQDVIQANFSQFTKENTYKYTEKDIIENKQVFFENIYSKSFFENEKLILISDVSDKILNLIEEIITSDINDVVIILIAKRLDKKSKLRNYFEKEKMTLIVPFYEDTPQTLLSIAKKILFENKINLSSENINLIIERSQGDRINLKNELQKIINLSQNNKKIELEDILKLTNLSENFSVYELVDNSLAKNQKKTLNILNENNFAIEDCIMILRIFLTKLKRLLKIQKELKLKKNIEKVLSNHKPAIFWKEKEIVKEQVKSLSYDKIKDLIVQTNDIELLIKKYPSTALNITTNFILEQSLKTNN